MHTTHKQFTDGFLACLGKLKVPSPSEQKKLVQYLHGFIKERILFQNTQDGKGVVALTLLLLMKKFPNLTEESVRKNNAEIIHKFSQDFKMDEGLTISKISPKKTPGP